MGGIAIFLAFLVAVAPAIGDLTGYPFYLSAVTLIFLLGLFDDLRALSPPQKLLIQIFAASFLLIGGFRLDLLGSLPLDLVLSFLWIVGITNAFNLLDHMDGVSSGVAGIAGVTLMLIYHTEGFVTEAAIAACIAGASLGFLIFNRNPASVFMGDSGSLFLGAALAALAIAPGASAARGLVGALAVPVLILLVPILDTSLVIITRLRSGRSVVMGGTDHTTHRLVVMGLSERAAAATLWTFAALGGAGAILISWLDPGWPLVVIALFLFCLFLAAAHLARIRIYEGGDAPPSRVGVLVSHLLHKKRIAEVLFDVAVATVTIYGALFLLGIPWEIFDRWGVIPLTAAVVAAKALAFNALGLYEGRWRDFTLSDLPRYGLAFLAAAALSAPFFYLGASGAADWGRVAILDLLLTANLILLSRVSERTLIGVSVRLQSAGRVGLIYGAGDRGEALARLLARGRPFRCHVIGFLDDRAPSVRRIHSQPVLGSSRELERVLKSHGVTDVFIACDAVPETEAHVEEECRRRGVQVTRFSWDFDTPVRAQTGPQHVGLTSSLISGRRSRLA